MRIRNHSLTKKRAKSRSALRSFCKYKRKLAIINQHATLEKLHCQDTDNKIIDAFSPPFLLCSIAIHIQDQASINLRAPLPDEIVTKGTSIAS